MDGHQRKFRQKTLGNTSGRHSQDVVNWAESDIPGSRLKIEAGEFRI